MVQDLQNTMFDKKTLVTAQIGDAVVSEVVDTGKTGAPTGVSWSVPSQFGSPISDLGRGNRIEFQAQITETATSSGAATAKLELLTSANADMSSPDVLWASADIALATLKAGYEFAVPPVPKGTTKRYLAFRYTNGTAVFTAGKISAFIVYERITGQM